jgi:precorrin-2 dehydrogenase/sirohydrochlorin ferrochelatase
MDVMVNAMDQYQPYPLFVNLGGFTCLIVGGGKVAERKTKALLEAGAIVHVVSPAVTVQIAKWADSGQLVWNKREYDGKMDGLEAVLVYATTDQPEVNERVVEDAIRRRQWVNRVDQPESGNFIVPAKVNKGRLQIAISTSGASPTMAMQIKRQLDNEYGPEFELALDWLHTKRLEIQHRINQAPKRHKLLRILAELEPARYFKNQQEQELEVKAEQLIVEFCSMEG